MTYNKEKYKQTQKERKAQIKKVLDDFIPTLVVSPDEMDKYLGALKGMYNYSLYNQIIATYDYYLHHYDEESMTEPELFQTFKRWKKAGRYIKKGEKACYMIRPSHYKIKEIDDDGNEVEKLKLGGFKPFAVFALSQTDGEPLQSQNLIKGEACISFEDIVEIYKEEFKILYEATQLRRGATNGEYIKISTNSNENYKISTIIHEVAHNRLGHLKDQKDTPTAELEAESVAYMVTTMLGLENEKSRLYICNWNGNDAREAVKERANTLIKTAEAIHKEIIGDEQNAF